MELRVLFAIGVVCALALRAGAAGQAHTPGNDDFENAAELTVDVPFPGAIITHATLQPGETLASTNPPAAGQTLWFKWTAEMKGMATVRLLETDFWPVLKIYEGDSLESLLPINYPLRTEQPFYSTADEEWFSVEQLIEGWTWYWETRLVSHFPAEPGKTYYIVIDAEAWQQPASGESTILLSQAASPVNDDRQHAQPIPLGASSLIGTFRGATPEPGEIMAPGGAGKTLWYEWTAPERGMYAFKSPGPEAPALLAIWKKTRLGTFQLVNHNATVWECHEATYTPFWGPRKELVASASAGQVLYLQVDADQSGLQTDFRFGIDFIPSPENDDFTRALPLTGNELLITGTTSGATKEPLEPEHGLRGGASVWYRWVAPASGILTVSSNYPVVYPPPTVTNYPSVFNGGGGGFIGEFGSDTCVGHDLDPNVFFVSFAIYEGENTSDLRHLGMGEADVLGGKTYYIAVDANRGLPGNFWMGLAFNPPPVNDHFENAIAITGGHVGFTSYNAGASAEAGEPSHAGMPARRSIWWQWTAPATAPAIIFTRAEDQTDFRTSVYTGDALSSLIPIASSQSGGTSFIARRDVQYYIAVDTVNGETGGIDLELMMVPPTTTLTRQLEQQAGVFTFLIRGEAGKWMRVERSIDLASWTTVETLLMEADAIYVTVPFAPDEAQAFYRATPLDN